MPMNIETHKALGLDRPAPMEVNGRSNSEIIAALTAPGDAPYHPCPEAHVREGVATGTVTKFAAWQESRIFPGTVRDMWVYVPPVLRGAPRLAIFNDGAGYLARDGSIRATTVLDNLLANQEIEPTVAIFINPGSSLDDQSPKQGQRSYEYDSVTPDYGDFLLTEVLPFVEKSLGIQVTGNPQHRTVCGISSGGICAFNVAWHHPGAFGRVLSHCGSFTNIRGGHNFPYLIRSTPRKDIRVFLQSGEQDASIILGDWPLANRSMANALAYAGYDYRFEFGTGGHSLRHGGAVFADSLRWLWRDQVTT
jgi:enterochelin esterase-like enzyme